MEHGVRLQDTSYRLQGFVGESGEQGVNSISIKILVVTHPLFCFSHHWYDYRLAISSNF